MIDSLNLESPHINWRDKLISLTADKAPKILGYLLDRETGLSNLIYQHNLVTLFHNAIWFMQHLKHVSKFLESLFGAKKNYYSLM